MASDVAHPVDTGGPYPVVRLTGVLDAAAVPGVRDTLLDVVAAQPEAVVIDVTDLRVTEPTAVGVLSDVARDIADWPDAHMVIAGPDHAGVWDGIGLPMWPDRSAALAALGPPDATRRISVGLEPVTGAARRSREVATEACGRWDRPELAGPACIVLTEMVNNVVAHAHTPMTVLLALHGATMSVAVRDRSRTAPRFAGLPAPTAYGGRGLVLIDSIASRWGSLLLGDGKVVWALLDPDQDPSGPARRQMHSAGMANPPRG